MKFIKFLPLLFCSVAFGQHVVKSFQPEPIPTTVADYGVHKPLIFLLKVYTFARTVGICTLLLTQRTDKIIFHS